MKQGSRAPMSEAQKFSLIKREVIYTICALVGLIIFWLIAGFGTAGLDVKIFHIPLWAVLGTVGVWFVAIAISFVLSKILFRDIDFGGDESDDR